jgi:epoxyqueuosine reductase
MIAKNIITNLAKEVGFDLVGVVPAGALVDEHKRFSEWLLAGNNSTLGYLERNVEKRFDARLLVEGANSVLICAIGYRSQYSLGYAADCRTKIASYALARDYHTTIKEMLRELAERLVEYAPELRFRAFTDSAPVAEKSLAVRAGFGWIGRNSLVVNPKLGSMMLLGELIINEVVDVYDSPMDGVGCGSCRACVDNCPNSAILDNRTIDARRCISCRTIEREGATEEIKLDGWIFGCDACQTVCPFNRHAPMHTNPRFDPIIAVDALDEARWQSMSEEEFAALASETPLTRSGLERIRGNIGK